MIIPIEKMKHAFSRTPVPGGWLVNCYINRNRLTAVSYFYPDPSHSWDGFVSWNDEIEMETR